MQELENGQVVLWISSNIYVNNNSDTQNKIQGFINGGEHVFKLTD